ncbi:MAG TPA: glycosyltransferase [Alphaproteobacteria bacterium]|nr:glycosyltransferase [Alphaproteobacteria bacterium]
MAETLFMAAAIFLFLAIHPFVTYPLSLRILRAFYSEPLAVELTSHKPLSFAVCLCAYNEAPVIGRTLNNLLALRESLGGNLQILLYVDGATDGTIEIAQRYADRIDLVVSSENHGKSYGLNRLADRVRADIVVLIDANVEIAADAFDNLRRYFADPTVGCVCGHLTFVNSDESVTAATGSFYWRLEERIKQLESDTGSAMGADGSLYAVRRECLQPIPAGLADDMYVSLTALCKGYRVIRAADVRAFERAAAEPEEEFRRKVRIGCQGFGAHLALWPQIRSLDGLTVYKYISHKFLRWFSAVTLGAGALLGFAWLAVVSNLAVALIAATIVVLILLAGWRMRLRPAMLVVDILLSFVATAIGAWRAYNGTLVGTWEPAGSVRKREVGP